MTPYEAGYADGLIGKKSEVQKFHPNDREEYVHGYIAGRRERRSRGGRRSR